MTKKKLIQMILSLPILMLLMVGCEINQTKSSSGSGSGSTSQDQPTHGQATINLMERNVFSGANLDPAFMTWLENYCKAGPTHLIMADLELVPDQMSRAGFVGSWAAQLYALATTYAGMFNGPPDDADAAHFWEIQDQIYAWWDRYVQAVVGVMQRAPQTTATIIINDGRDRVGMRLGPATKDHMGSVANRVEIGATVPEELYKRR